MIPEFPQFAPLTFELEQPYNKLVGSLPPYSDINFATLQIWWNLSEQLAVAKLNENLVINYHLPFDQVNSGLSLVGQQHVDQSIKTIFDYLRREGRAVRLVHVPEFVTQEISKVADFEITEEHDYHEYILDSQALVLLKGPRYKRIRNQINRFLREVGDSKIELKSLDLGLEQVQDEILQTMSSWENQKKHDNDPKKTEYLAIRKTFDNVSSLKINNLALLVNGKLHGIAIYHQPGDKNFYIGHHLKYSPEFPYASDYLLHQFARHAVSNNVYRLNIEMDLGIDAIRQNKLMLGPITFFRKYTVKPRVEK